MYQLGMHAYKISMVTYDHEIRSELDVLIYHAYAPFRFRNIRKLIRELIGSLCGETAQRLRNARDANMLFLQSLYISFL